MTKLTGAWLLVGGTIVLLAGPVVVEAREPSLPAGEKTFARLDTDKDGRIAAGELAPKADRRFMRLDTDKDGAVTAAEIDQWLKAAAERRRDRIMEHLDADRDGRVTAAEVEARVAAMISVADADRDGGVTLAEARAYHADKRKEYFARSKASRTSD